MSEFIQMWQQYSVAIDNRDWAAQVVFGSKGQIHGINIPDLIALKKSTMLEF